MLPLYLPINIVYILSVLLHRNFRILMWFLEFSLSLLVSGVFALCKYVLCILCVQPILHVSAAIVA